MFTRERPGPPRGLREIQRDRDRVWIRPEARSWVEEAFARHRTLYEAARVESGGRTHLQGRAPVFLVHSGEGAWAVRHYVRGGAVASHLGDRYLALGVPRPFQETRASERLRSAGIPTPPILAAAVYPSGLVYRADLVTAYLPDASDLGAILFGGAGAAGPEARRGALERSGALIARVAALGVHHPDLNVKNLLVRYAGTEPTVHLIDLDGCRDHSHRDPARIAAGMERRLLRSLAKWERRTGQSVSSEERAALRRGVRGS